MCNPLLHIYKVRLTVMESTLSKAAEVVSSTLYTAMNANSKTNAVVLWPYGNPIYVFLDGRLQAECLLTHEDLCKQLEVRLGKTDGDGWAELVYLWCTEHPDLLPNFTSSIHPKGKGLLLELAS